MGYGWSWGTARKWGGGCLEQRWFRSGCEEPSSCVAPQRWAAPLGNPPTFASFPVCPLCCRRGVLETQDSRSHSLANKSSLGVKILHTPCGITGALYHSIWGPLSSSSPLSPTDPLSFPKPCALFTVLHKWEDIDTNVLAWDPLTPKGLRPHSKVCSGVCCSHSPQSTFLLK